ncbi:MAG: GntR family transcriptional regulator [Kiritimatiellae bacterium]|nr:GntR family transcriptional regulator [Kiritimatiellia bacterium]
MSMTRIPPAGPAAAPRVRQVYGALRQRMASLRPGAALPPVPEIMRDLAASQTTVDKAYRLLESEGLIERQRRRGVFVADRKATGEIAVVLSDVCLDKGASPAYTRICARLRRKLHADNPGWSVKLHLGAGTVPGPELPATLDLLEPTVLPRLRGVLSFNKLYDVETKLAAARVPVVYLGARHRVSRGERLAGVGSVILDAARGFRDGIACLAESGCRNVCLLHPRYVGTARPSVPSLVPGCAKDAAACGLRFRDEWIGYEEGGWGERQGYELFRRVWSQGEHPDGVLVVDDILCHGVLRAIQELGLELPRDLNLVTNANRGFDFPYPRPVTRIEFDLDDVADRAARMLEALTVGRTQEPPVEWVPARLVMGTTSSRPAGSDAATSTGAVKDRRRDVVGAKGSDRSVKRTESEET